MKYMLSFCSKMTFEATLTTHLNMAFNFQPFVKNVSVVILRELITGNVLGLSKSFYLLSLCSLFGLGVAVVDYIW